MNNIDSLTGFTDRSGCLLEMEMLTADSTDSGNPLAVIWLDIDRFKKFNDSLGHQAGDGIIKELASRFRKRVSGRAELCRMGGDEFVFLIPRCDLSQARQLANELARTVEEPITIGNLILRQTASIGIAIHHCEDSVSLIERADRAMIAAKGKGGNCIICSGEESVPGRLGISLAREELSIESMLHIALETGGLSLHYQPIIRANGEIEAVEALMRCSVNGENISPVKLIPVAEKTGLIIRLGEWCLLQGAMQARLLYDEGYHIKVAVNVSRAQLVSSKFTQALHAALICSNVNPELLELELTESLFMDVSEIIQTNLKNALSAGVSLSIDDFGTGYSCLANLKDIPAKKLKLDRAFITVLPEDRRALSVVKAMTQLGHELGMTVVAEGCENREVIDTLLEAGVDAIQGFFFARPMPEDSLLDWLEKRNTK